MDLCHWKWFFLSRTVLSVSHGKTPGMLAFSHSSPEKQSHGSDQHRLIAHPNLPGRQIRSSCQLFISLQRSVQCHLQCKSMFGNVASNLFQPMKWNSWLTSLHVMTERLLFNLEGAFVNQQSAIIILSQNIFFTVCINWFSLLINCLFWIEHQKQDPNNSFGYRVNSYSDVDFWKGSDDWEPDSSAFSPLTSCGI